MEWVETTGRSIDEAKDLALDRLGVDEADAEFEVVEEPRPGLFGRMRGEARVRARVRPTRPRPKVERRERRRRNGGRSESSRSESESGRSEGGSLTNPADDETMDEETEVSEVESSNRPAAANAGSGESHAAEQAEAATSYLLGLASAFGLSATADVVRDEDDVEVRLHGDDLGLLIGPRGQTLQAVQDLTRIAVQRRDDDRRTRLRIDIAGYREKRREALARFTEQVVKQVVASGEARALEPMSSPDRKVVHDTAGALAGVATRSEGEDPFRRVVIMPADAGA
jgi:spoIIIJ-associated protein